MVSMFPRNNDPANALTGLRNITLYPGKITIKLSDGSVRSAVSLEFDHNQVVIFVSTKQVDLTRWSTVANAG